MKFSAVVLAVSAALASANPFAPTSDNTGKSAYVNKLLKGAKVVRALEQEQNAAEEVVEYQVDISTYSVKFGKCQFVKSYDDDLADDEDSETVLATKRFVIFRLCPNNSCSSCSYGYGEYMIDLETFLEATVEYHQTVQQEMCNACAACGNWNGEEGDDQVAQDQNGDANRKLQNYNVDCNSCYDECMKIENMQANGYIDATNFLDCQMIYDPADDGKSALYAGPMCASQGTKIKIGVFTDQNCNYNDSSKDVDDYLMDANGYPMKLSHALLKTVYASDSCVSCLAQNENANQNAQGDDAAQQEQQEAQVLDMCGQLYEASAKCEKSHGFNNGYSSYNGYENQVANENVVCNFIDSVGAGSYDELGEIVVNGASSALSGGAITTGGQKFALTFFILGTVGLAMYAGMLHSKLTKGSADGLFAHGGAMA